MEVRNVQRMRSDVFIAAERVRTKRGSRGYADRRPPTINREREREREWESHPSK